MKVRLLVLILLLTAGFARGAVMMEGTTPGLGSFIAVDAGGNAIVAAGISNGTGIGDFDVVLVSFREDGKVLWEKAYGGTGRDLVSSVKVLPDGSILIAGGSASFRGGWIFLVDKEGNVKWSRVYNTEMIYSAVPYGGGILALSSASEKPLLLRLNSEGLVESAYIINTSLRVVPVTMRVFPGQGIYIAGIAQSNATGSPDFWLAKVDADGKLLWERTYGFRGMDRLYDLEVDAKGVTLVGYSTISNNRTNVNLLVIRTNPDGRLLWARLIGGPREDWANAVSLLPDGKLVLSGITYSAPTPQAWLLFMDEHGTVGESVLLGSRGIDWIRALKPLPSGEIVFAGGLNGTSLGTGSLAKSSFFLGIFSQNGSFTNCRVTVQRLDFPVEGVNPKTWVRSGGKPVPASVSVQEVTPRVKTIRDGLKALCPSENPTTTTTSSGGSGSTTTTATTSTTTTTTTTTTAATTTTTTTTSSKGGWKLCGPGLLIALPLLTAFLWRRKA
ncbi:Amylopullulanase [Thermococcus sp. AM4]|nr:Amylopullulanase [Thermococcus sp. AM4]